MGFSGPRIEQFVLEGAGYPAAVASIFAHALHRCKGSGDRPAQLLDHLSTTCPHGSASLETNFHFRYLLRLVSPKSQGLSVACWRRYAGGLGWQRRCGPMPLERFLARFLAVPGIPVSPVAALIPVIKRGLACPRGASS